MSQSGRLTTNQPVPGAGIQTVTGNLGGAVPGDGAANIDLIGVGGIIVTGIPGANTLQISSGAVAATYTTDTGVALPDGLGNLNVIGGANINTDNAVANTVTINLNNSIIVPGSIDGHDITATHNITSQTGDIVATIGDITALAGIVYGVGGARFDDQVHITANGIDSTGPTILSSLNRGIVQVNAAHTLFSDEGTNGEILIGSSVGPSTWGTITAAQGITIVNGNNSITISTAGTVARQYNADAGNAVPALGIIDITGGANINTTAAGHTVLISLNPSVNLAGSLQTGTTITAGTNLLVGGTSNLVGLVTTGADLVVTGSARVSTNLRVDGTTRLVGAVVTDSTLEVGTDVLIHNTLAVNSWEIVLGDFTANSAVTFPAITNGVLISDAGGHVSASNGNPNGTNGQLIVSGPTGPAWSHLTSAAGSVAITYPGPNQINLEAAAAVPIAFRAFLNPGVPYAANLSTPPYKFGTLQAMSVTYNIGGAFYPGDGAAAPATFTAPANGVYNFTIKGCLGRSSAATDSSWQNIPCYLQIFNVTNPATYSYLAMTSSSVNSAGLMPVPHICNIEMTEDINLNAGDVVQFIMQPQCNNNYVSQNLQIGPNYAGNGSCSITGIKIA